jgi:hypothetical protein
MTKKMSYAAPVVIGLAFVSLLVAVSTAHASVDPYLDGQVKIIEGRIGSWETKAYLIEWLTYTVIAIGIIVAALQPAKNHWIKIGAAALAVVSALIVAFNHTFFAADDRAYQKVARHAQRKLADFTLELNRYSEIDNETRDGLFDKFRTLQQNVDDFEGNTIFGGATEARNIAGLLLDGLFTTTAWADQHTDSVRIPDWAQKVPTDERNIYFLSTAEASTFGDARNNAVTKAHETAIEMITKAASASSSLARQPELIAKLAKALSDSAQIAETFTAPSSGGGFQSFALLRMSKNAARFTAQSVFVESGVPYDTSFLDKVNTGFH